MDDDPRKTESIRIRATALQKARWVEASGGPRKLSEWLTGLADDASRIELRPNGGEIVLPKPIPPPTPPPPVLDLTKVERHPMTPPADEECPRWMHHRSGVYCGTCKKVN